MGIVVCVGNEKGGTGKTTLSTNIVAAALAKRIDVLLVDADPGQQSAAKWAALRAQAHPEARPARCVSLTSRAIIGELRDLAARYAMVVVDTGAEDGPQLRAAITVAHTLVIPLQPDHLDLWTMPTMSQLCAGVADINPYLRVIVVVNRIPHQSRTAVADVAAWLAESCPDFRPRATVGLINRSTYGRCSGEGLGITESPRPDPKAIAEFRAIYQLIMERK